MTIGTASENPARKRIASLDGLRGAAIVLVLLRHFVPDRFSDFGVVAPSFAIRIIVACCRMGWIGVDLFFVLSGFLITGILLDSKGTKNYFLSFYARRTLRIFPLYYATLTSLCVVLPVVLSEPTIHRIAARTLGESMQELQKVWHAQGWMWLYCTNIKIALDGRWDLAVFVDHFWSLAVEEHFYLVWPIVVLVASPRALLKCCFACMLVSFLLRGLLVLIGAGGIAAYVLTPCRIDGLTMGAAAAVTIRLTDGTNILYKWSKWFGLTSLVVLVVMSICYGGLEIERNSVVVLGPSLLGAGFLWLLTILVGSPRALVTRIACARPLRLLGKYSYGLYVLHPFLLRPCKAILPLAKLCRWMHSDVLGLIAFLGFKSCCAFALAWLSFNLFEKQFLAMKRVFPERISHTQVIATASRP